MEETAVFYNGLEVQFFAVKTSKRTGEFSKLPIAWFCLVTASIDVLRLAPSTEGKCI